MVEAQVSNPGNKASYTFSITRLAQVSLTNPLYIVATTHGGVSASIPIRIQDCVAQSITTATNTTFPRSYAHGQSTTPNPRTDAHVQKYFAVTDTTNCFVSDIKVYASDRSTPAPSSIISVSRQIVGQYYDFTLSVSTDVLIATRYYLIAETSGQLWTSAAAGIDLRICDSTFQYATPFATNPSIPFNSTGIQERTVQYPPIASGPGVSSAGGCHIELGQELIWVSGTPANKANVDYSLISQNVNTVQTRSIFIKDARYLMDVSFYLRHYLAEIDSGNPVTFDSPQVNVVITLPPNFADSFPSEQFPPQNIAVEPFAPYFLVDLQDQEIDFDINLPLSRQKFYYYYLPSIVQYNLSETIHVNMSSSSRYTPNFVQWDYRKNKFIFFGLKQAYIGNYTLGVKLTSPSMPNMTTQYYFNLRIKDTTTYLPTTYPPNVTIVNHWRITA
jgi:hypothetical protein